jgi:hypothetical protein
MKDCAVDVTPWGPAEPSDGVKGVCAAVKTQRVARWHRTRLQRIELHCHRSVTVKVICNYNRSSMTAWSSVTMQENDWRSKRETIKQQCTGECFTAANMSAGSLCHKQGGNPPPCPVSYGWHRMSTMLPLFSPFYFLVSTSVFSLLISLIFPFYSPFISYWLSFDTESTLQI